MCRNSIVEFLTRSRVTLGRSSKRTLRVQWNENGPLMERGEGQMGNVGLKYSTSGNGAIRTLGTEQFEHAVEVAE